MIPSNLARLVIRVLVLWCLVWGPPALAEPAPLTGYLSVLWGDPVRGSSVAPTRQWFVTDETGRRTEVRLPLKLLARHGGVRGVMGKRVVVQVAYPSAHLDSERPQPLPVITSLQILPLVPRASILSDLSSAQTMLIDSLGCAREGSIRSVFSGPERPADTSIEFENPSSDIRVIYWLNANGDRVQWSTLGPRTSVVAEAWADYAWLVTDGPGECLGIYVLETTPGTVVLSNAELLSGTRPWVTLLCHFTDTPDPVPDLALYDEVMGAAYPGLTHYWHEVSYGYLDLTGSVTRGWYTLPGPRSQYVTDPDGDGEEEANFNLLFEDCTAAADPDVYYPAYSGIQMVFEPNIDSWGGWGGVRVETVDGATRAYGVTWVRRMEYRFDQQSVYAHEHGHGFGLPHSSGPYEETYDSKWDVMSGGSFWDYDLVPSAPIAVHPIAHQKDQLGWILPAQKLAVEEGETYTIEVACLSEAAPAGTYHLVQLPIDGETEFYTVEARCRTGYDIGVPGDAVIIHHVDTIRADGRPAKVVDADNNGDPNDAGAMWQPGELFTDAAAGILVEVETQTFNGYEVTVTAGTPFQLPTGNLESPGADSYKSGIGIISGWVCSADSVQVTVDGTAIPTAYGTERTDTASVCGDSDNGFGALWNWNKFGDGLHTAVAYVDGVEFDRANLTVTTFGVEFLSGKTGNWYILDFPHDGDVTYIQWDQSEQNFVIYAPTNTPAGGSASAGANLENPGIGSHKSGIGIISGWHCSASQVVVVIDGVSIQTGYGTERTDTASVCGDSDNGFGALWNWNKFGDGLHTAIAYADGVEFARANFAVQTFGEEFLSGTTGGWSIADFPDDGDVTTIQWDETVQNIVITAVQ